MTPENESDDGLMLSRALSSLRAAGSTAADGWTPVRAFWKALADGNIDERDSASWAREIATRVVQKVLDAEAQDRPRLALAALGLIGVERDHWSEREYVRMYEDFSVLAAEDGQRFSLSRRQLAQQMLNNGFFDGLSVQQAVDAIDYIKKTLPRKK